MRGGKTPLMKTKLVIFGITGDLAQRKLLPALREMIKTDDFEDLEVVGVSRRQISADDLFSKDDSLYKKLSVFTMDLASAEDYVRLKEYLALGDDTQALLYLSVPPAATYQIVEFLGEAGLNMPGVKLLLEKPFGMDYVSAVEMNTRMSEFFDEGQLYRIDHYLAKEMAQNIVTFRQHNALFNHVWNGKSIEKVEVVATETLTIEGRADFYEQTGALRDVLQGHLMQLLALVLMAMPEDDLRWEEVPKRRQEALEKLLPANPDQAYRAQYEGYDEAAGNPGSTTETFAFTRLYSSDPIWKDVPLELTTGKALSEKKTEIRLHFRKSHEAQGNVLVLRIQPSEAVEMEFLAKKPGYERALETHAMAFTYPEDVVLGDAYEQVLVDAIRSRKSVFASSGEILASWVVLQPLLDAWAMVSETPAKYQVGAATHTICRV